MHFKPVRMIVLSRLPSLFTTRNSISPFRSSITAGYGDVSLRLNVERRRMLAFSGYGTTRGPEGRGGPSTGVSRSSDDFIRLRGLDTSLSASSALRLTSGSSLMMGAMAEKTKEKSV